MPFNPVLPATLCAAILLAGCSSAGKPETQPAVAADAGRCAAAPVQALIGKPLSAALVEQAKREAGAQRVRVLHPHDAVTLDYNPQRLNIDVDDRQQVLRLTCG
ncbi:I78 family peptidase inhibitor [Pseudomonas panipatensis]|uniref:Peptidase inhibitor I78 family protein n=1 Tax=Pseudomonas panipatensis TaxID=428992 RepID=A0A1G8IJU6_9PSED|nr:I78 family peptidase inhibitor [Pseudomonas panipatensis]SDI19057.1 Peptidase inhibitor I78 family protein [Pseudomonas panipatensis]SMP73748.1 Peptidase inhibitor I78 family protein [Pseudomonas panipatensis]